jgi:hypothetical protein
LTMVHDHDPVGEDVPVEVFNFFRIEVAAVLDRVERLGDELASRGESAAPSARRDLAAALTRIGELAGTFGFAGAEKTAAVALAEVGQGRLGQLQTHIAALREAVTAPTPSPLRPRSREDSVSDSIDRAERLVHSESTELTDPTGPTGSTELPAASDGSGEMSDAEELAPRSGHDRGDTDPEIAILTTEPPTVATDSELAAKRPTADDAVVVAQPAVDPDIVAIETLCYSGVGALHRALELEPLLREVAGNAEAHALAEELFDLIRLALPPEARGSAD